jgi:hypothetical protein
MNVFLDPFIHNGTKFKLTSSIGVSIFRMTAQTPTRSLKTAKARCTWEEDREAAPISFSTPDARGNNQRHQA